MDTNVKLETDPTPPVQVGTQKGFFKHVFAFNADTKGDIMNLFQYCLIAFIPLVLLLKLLEYIFPRSEEKKGNVELLAEIFGQLAILLVGIYFIHRFITYFNPFSGKKFEKINLFSCVLIFLVLAFNSSGNLTIAQSVDQLYNNIYGNWKGDKDDDQPTKIENQAPTVINDTQMPLRETRMPHFDDMYVDKPTTLPAVEAMGGYMGQRNAMGAPMMGANEPMAANEMLGGSGMAF